MITKQLSRIDKALELKPSNEQENKINQSINKSFRHIPVMYA
jgi:hypothetical protein